MPSTDDQPTARARVRAGLQALGVGIPQGWPEYVLHQMVTVMRGGEEVKLSKRAGSYFTLRDLIEETSADATSAAPWTRLNTPGGSNPSTSSAKRSEVGGACSGGLMMTLFPAASGAAALPAQNMKG